MQNDSVFNRIHQQTVKNMRIYHISTMSCMKQVETAVSSQVIESVSDGVFSAVHDVISSHVLFNICFRPDFDNGSLPHIDKEFP